MVELNRQGERIPWRESFGGSLELSDFVKILNQLSVKPLTPAEITMKIPAYSMCFLSAALILPASVMFAQAHGHFSSSETIVDGLPTSSVSMATSDTLEMGAFVTPDEIEQTFPSAPDDEGLPETVTGTSDLGGAPTAQIDIEAGGGTGTVGDQDIDTYTFRIPYSLKLNPRGTLQFSAPLSKTIYRDANASWDPNTGALHLSDAHAYGFGLNLGYAYQAITKTESRAFRWKVTPSLGVFHRDCSDLYQGAWIYNLGLSSSFAWQFSPGWVLNFGNSVSFAWNDAIKDYPDPIRDNQQMLSNGVQLYRMLGRWTLYGYVLDTEALRDVLVDSYQTYAVGAGFKLTKNRSLRLTFIYETGNAGYHSVRGTLGSSWRF